MRARAGDPPRTMPQKILAGRAADPALRGDLVQVKVDQVILTRAPARAYTEAVAVGLKKSPLEVAIAYDGTCITDAAWNASAAQGHHGAVVPEMVAAGIQIAKAGIGFPAPVHLERFGSPARLALTDDPRLAPLGGVGMLVLVVSPGQLGQALAQGSVWLRPPRSVQVLLSGFTRPFVCARDVALELLRRGIRDVVRRIEEQHQAPVVLEFSGASAKLLNVGERAVLASVAPMLGASAGIFLSDEKTETFLRDQRRSKAHRTLFADQGAPCDDAVTLDLGTVDPLLIDENGVVRPVRDLQGKPVHQAILGGDSGTTLRDLLAAAALLKSKRVPPKLDFLFAPPSRQALEVLAQDGSLADLVATGARVVEPDRRVATGEMYPVGPGRSSIRTFDPEPLAPGFVSASAETLAYAVATGTIGDPRAFKRPVRVTIPRVLPTDDVLVTRERKAEAAPKRDKPLAAPAPIGWKGAETVPLSLGLPADGAGPVAVLVRNGDEARGVAGRLAALGDRLRVVVGAGIPSGVSSALAGAGVAVFATDVAGVDALKTQPTLAVPAPASWGEGFAVTAGKGKVQLKWTAIGPERQWVMTGTSRPAARKLGSQRGRHPPRGGRAEEKPRRDPHRVERRVEPDVLRHHVHDREEQGHAEERARVREQRFRERHEAAERDPEVEPEASAAHDHRVAGEHQRPLGALMAVGGEHAPEELFGPTPEQAEERERADEHQAAPKGEDRALPALHYLAMRSLNMSCSVKNPKSAPKIVPMTT